jgi:DNA-binding transcriptional MerR regulator
VEDRAYLSIGEVLSLLKEEFPDVTISKIRFLESQGLLDPERTPSGYRKFYDTDVERLRWILRQQREHFLPLKVIKGRLRGGAEATEEGTEDLASADLSAADLSAAGLSGADLPAGDLSSADGAVATDEPVDALAGQALSGQTLGDRPAEAGSTAGSARGMGSGSGSGTGSAQGQFGTPGAGMQAAATTVGGAGFPGSMGNYLDLPPLPIAHSGVSLTLSELGAATGLDDDLLKELEKFGLLSGRKVASSTYYDEDALNVATIAAGFMKYGVEARHLRMYKTAGEREAGFFEQVVMPMLKQRNPQARRQATEALAELSQLGQGLRAAMLRQLLRHYFEG